jgi:uncharacterized protein YsxB (DUF464 family)
MIRVTIRQKNKRIYVFKVTGHALSAPYGEDLVCAGVSAIMTGGANAFQMRGIRIQNREGLSDIQVDDLLNDDHQTILNVMRIQLKTIAEAYPTFISINEQEDS